MTAQWLEVVTVKDEPNFIEKIIEVDGKKYIVPKKGTNVGELLSDLKLNINENNNSALKIKEQSPTEFINDESILKTDQKIVIDNPEEDTGKIIVSTGDLNSDGNVDIRDISKLNNYRIDKEKVESQWTVSQKLAFKCLKELDTTDAEMGEIGLRDIASLNNCRIKND